MKQMILAIAIIGFAIPVMAQEADALTGNEGIPNHYHG